MSMSSTGVCYAKRRRQSCDGFVSLPSMAHVVEDSVAHELTEIKSAMHQLLEHSRLQTANMANMERKMGAMADALDYLKARNTHLETSMQQAQKTLHATRTLVHDANATLSRRLDDLGHRQRHQEALIKNQKWTYSALAPYQAYWDSIDEEEHVEAASEFLEQIEKNTRDMRYGEACCDRDGTSEEPTGTIVSVVAALPFNAIFLPHWEEFASALEQYQHALKCLPEGSKSSFQLYGMELSRPVLGVLSRALRSAHFHSFVLENNSFGRAGVAFALKYLRGNRILKEFCMVDNPIDHPEDVAQLCETIESHPLIETIELGGCRGEGIDGHEMLQSIMTAGMSKLKKITMTSNGISTGGRAFLSDFLATNPVLETLELSGNNLNDEDACSIASAMKRNTNLRLLDIENNGLTSKGWDALRRAEFDPSSLNSSADSNHTCFIFNPNHYGINGGTFQPFVARRKKIYAVLSSRNRECSNVRHFDNVPLEFLPDMLRSIQQFSDCPQGRRKVHECGDAVDPLSVVFEVMRMWGKAFSVYESLSNRREL